MLNGNFARTRFRVALGAGLKRALPPLQTDVWLDVCGNTPPVVEDAIAID
jgi:hypothetical protein